MNIKDAFLVLIGEKIALSKNVPKWIGALYEQVRELNPNIKETMDATLKTKLDSVKEYLASLPGKFQALQKQIDELKANDDADKTKIDDLTTQVNDLKKDNEDIVGIADELVAAKEASDAADGEETPPVEPPVEPTP